MLVRIILLFLALFPAYGLQAGVWDKITGIFRGETKAEPPNIRVLIKHDLPGIDVEVRGRYTLYDPFDNSYLSTRFTGKRKYMQTMNDGLKWGEAFPGLYQLKIVPERPETRTIIDNREYRGPLFIYDIGGTISLINECSVEDYVYSTLAEQDLKSLPPEIISAMAIVSRTNASYFAAHPKTNYWAVDGQKTGFKGIPHASENSTTAEDAVKMTRHMIMSRTGIYEGVATPFLAEFDFVNPGPSAKDVAISQISLEQAKEMAEKGAHAAQILAKAFPGINIILNYQ